MSSDTSNESTLSIGAISNSTGIPAATLRTWERRYGFPDPERNDSGHRVYPPDIVEHLQLISEALDHGYRASNVVGLSKQELNELLEPERSNRTDNEDVDHPPTADDDALNGHSGPVRDTDDGSATRSPDSSAVPSIQNASTTGGPTPSTGESDDPHPGLGDDDEWMTEWMNAVEQLDGEQLDLYFRNAWNRLGGLDFLQKRAAPFLGALGHRWQIGEIDVAHEHYTSQCLQDFLSSHWRPLSDRNKGPSVVCATFSGEQHSLGLHFAAIVLAMAGWQIIFLGPSTPHRDILRTADIKPVDAVLISISSAFNKTMASRELDNLNHALPDDIELLVGGAGAHELDDVDGARRFKTLMDFYEWSLDQVR